MWTEQETKRYEEYLEKHWTRDGQPSGHQWTLTSPELKDSQKRLDKMVWDALNEIDA